MAIDIDKIYTATWEHYLSAKKNVPEKRAILEHAAPISDVIPGFDADKSS